MPIKLIVTDLDGTFFNDDHMTVPERNTKAFYEANRRGVKTAIASGRTKVLTSSVLKQLPFLDYLITSNGAVTYDLKTGEVISSRLMENRQALEVFKILDGYSLPYEIYFEGDCFISAKGYEKYDNKHIPEHFLKILKDHINVRDSLPDLIGGKGIEKVNVLRIPREIREELKQRLKNTGPIYITSSISENMEMNNYHANKGFAVRCLAGINGIDQKSVMCFGDGENDTQMLEYADYSFAMANGSDFAKISAKFITGVNSEGGVGEAIEKYVLG